MRKLYILIFLVIVSTSPVFGQAGNSILLAEIDSLKREISKQQSDSTRASILRMISGNYLHINPDSAISYGEKAIEAFQNIRNVPDEIVAMGIIGEALMKQGNLPKALELGLGAIDKAEGLGVRKTGVGRSYDNLAEIYYFLGDYKKSLEYYWKLIPRGDVDIVGVAFGFYGIAQAHEAMGNLDSAIVYLDRSRETFDQINNSRYTYQYDVYPAWYNLRAKVLLKQNKPELALADLRTTLKTSLRSEEVFHTSNTYNDISTFYNKMNQKDSSIYYAEKAIEEANKILYIKGILDGSTTLAGLYEFTDPEKALFYFKLASETEKKLYGSGNIQVIKDMITQNEKKKQELEIAQIAYKNRLKTNAFLGSSFTLIVIAIFLYRNNRAKQKSKTKIEKAYDQLKSTQNQLIHSEKMASLGELTAGIAHEIQNPLNFVNNFSEVNRELIEELNEEIDKGNTSDAKTIAKNLLDNEEKVMHHGKRAEAIVKSMLQHSRSSTGEKEPTDINALADEYLRLAYHGFRAKDKSFNADFKTQLADDLPRIEVVPQDIGRVLLNLINNAFQAVKGVESPEVIVKTQMKDGMVEISVRDNGPGVPEDIKEKIFQPFFTTKPTGEGTGLGLSMSYDIVTKGHGGELNVETKEGAGTEFKIELPL